MTATQTDRGIPPELRRDYEAERRRKTFRAVWGVTIIALLMYPATTLLDWVIARDHYRELSIARFSETGALLLLLLVLRWMEKSGRAERLAHVMAWVLAGVIAVSLDAFVLILGGPSSPYYGGLTLLLTAVLVAYPWEIARTAWLVLAIVAQFNLVMVLADPGWPWIGYFIANYFYVGTIFIGLVWRITSEKLNREEFLQRKSAQAEQSNLAATLLGIADGVITTDTMGNVVLMNRVAQELTGWSRDEALGRPLEDVFRISGRDDANPDDHPVARVLAAGQIFANPRPVSLVSRQGRERFIEESAGPIQDGDGGVTGVVLVFRDVTLRRRMEEELQRAHKLESVGLLAGGIAHDFNNLLTGIWGSVSLARSDVPADGEANTWLAEAEKGVMRARDLTQQLLTFSKGGAPIRRTARIGDLIADSARFSLRGSNVRCEVSIPDDLWSVEVDESQMSQVISNLVINADEAMPAGGRIRVSARNLPNGAALPPSLPAGRYIEVAVEDEGIGIAPEHLARVFDPYFTTKKKGSGLGLAICFGILQKHEGLITVDSELGKGSTFRIHLPASTKAPTPRVDDEPHPLSGRGRALVMDDDPSIRDVSSMMLSRLGYEVQTAADGAEAVEAYLRAMESGRPFTFAIMDLTVPGGMGGLEAARAVLAIDPDARLIVSSGYSNDPIMSEYRDHGFRGVIPKPYEPALLGRTVQDALSKTDC
jgi:PAS domain S-box-containing protein